MYKIAAKDAAVSQETNNRKLQSSENLLFFIRPISDIVKYKSSAHIGMGDPYTVGSPFGFRILLAYSPSTFPMKKLSAISELSHDLRK